MLLDTSNIADYRLFLQIKQLPKFRFSGNTAEFPDEYADRLGMAATAEIDRPYKPMCRLFDYQRDISALAIRKRKFAVFADCVAAGTLVDTEFGQIPIESMDRPQRVWCRDDNGRAVLAQASASWVNGYAPIYEFICESGRRIRATCGHRFLTDAGWIRGGELPIGARLLVSVACRHRSTSEPYQASRPADDQSSFRTTASWMGGYFACFRQDGAQPLPTTSSDQSLFPFQAYALERIRQLLLVDDRENGLGYNRQHRLGARLSMPDCVRQGATTAEGVQCQPPSSGPACIAASSHISQQVAEGTIHPQRGDEPHPSATQQNAGDQCEPFGFSYDTLASVHYIRDDAFYDIRVDEFANYFADGFVSHNCGLGKTFMMAEFARHCAEVLAQGQCVLWVCPLMVVRQTIAEIAKFYGDALPVEQVHAKDLARWLTSGTGRIGITNYDALDDDTPQGRIGAMILDESSMLKSMYGKWGQTCIRLGKGVNWKLCGTGTPAPNDRIEYGNHAVFLDQFPTLNAFLARYFVNRGQTDNRWELKPHALRPFYQSLSHWCIFLTNPATYGWKDNTTSIPPIHVHIHDVPLTPEQRMLVQAKTGNLIVTGGGGITSRSTMGQLAKGYVDGEEVPTNKPQYIRSLVNSWPSESTIIWCVFNREQETMERAFPDAASILGETPYEDRETLIDEFKAGTRTKIISKPKVMGFGLNLQIATRQVFSGLQDSYESFYQAVKRSNRVGSTRPLNVHIPITEIERPMVDTVLDKAHRVQQDTEEQEQIFRESMV